MVSGARQGPRLDSGGGAVREVSPFPATLAKPQPRRPRSPSKWVEVPGCGVRPGVPGSGRRGTEARDQGPTHTLRWRGRWQVVLLSAIPAIPANALSVDLRSGPLRRGEGGADALGKGA